MTTRAHYKSKTLAAWLALLFGSLGAHRLYLHGRRDIRAWLYPIPTLLGLSGLIRMRNLGLDDETGTMLLPLLGLSLSMAMVSAIMIALTADAKWDLQHNRTEQTRSSGWGAVLAAVVGLFVGGTILTSTLAFGGQRFFEWQTQKATAVDSEK